MAMRVAAVVALVCLASAAEIGSFALWSEKYTEAAATVGATALNGEVVGLIEPTANAELWRWYRNVGADGQAKAKEVMDAAAPAGATSVAIGVANFKKEYDAEVKVTSSLAVDALTPAKAADGIKTMYDVLGETKPVVANSIPLWKTYRSFNADVRDQVKKQIVRAPFDKLFIDTLAKAKKGQTSFASASLLVANTQGAGAGTKDEDGKDTALVWGAFNEADRADLNALLVGVLKDNQN